MDQNDRSPSGIRGFLFQCLQELREFLGKRQLGHLFITYSKAISETRQPRALQEMHRRFCAFKHGGKGVLTLKRMLYHTMAGETALGVQTGSTLFAAKRRRQGRDLARCLRHWAFLGDGTYAAHVHLPAVTHQICSGCTCAVPVIALEFFFFFLPLWRRNSVVGNCARIRVPYTVFICEFCFSMVCEAGF